MGRLEINVDRTCGPDRRKIKGFTFAFCLPASCLTSKFIYCVVAVTVPAVSVAIFPEVSKRASFNMKLCASLGTHQVPDWDCWSLQTSVDYPDYILPASLLNPSLLTIHSANYVPPENPTEYACWLSWVLSGPDAGPLSALLFHNVQAKPVDYSHPRASLHWP